MNPLEQEKKKKEQDKKKVPEKVYYDIRVETLIPATVSFRVLAEDEQKALLMIKNIPPRHINYQVNRRRDIKMMVYEAGSSILKFIKNL